MSTSPRPISQILLILLVLSGALHGEARGQRGTWVNHVNPSFITEIVLRNGGLYIATDGGLLVYQPSDSTFEQFNNTMGLPSNLLTCLAFDNGGSLYVGTDESGIARLDPVAGGFDVSTLNATFHGLADDRITTLAAWGDSVAYGTKQGAGLIVSGFPGVRFLARQGLPSESIADVFADGDFLWFATDNGVARLDRLGFITVFSTGLPSLVANVFARDDTSLWVGTNAGVARFNPADSTWIPAGLAAQAVFSISFDGAKLWVASRDAFFENDGSGWTSHSILPIYVKYLLNRFVSEARGLQPMPDGSVYLGIGQPDRIRGANLIVWDGASVRDLPFNGPPMNDLLRAAFDIDGSLWVSSWDFGVGKLTPAGTWFNYTPALGDTNLTQRFTNLTLLPDSKGTKWFSSLWRPVAPIVLDELDDGLDLSYTNDIWTHHDIGSGGGDGLGSLRNQKAKEDPAGNRWFLSDDDPDEVAPASWRGISILSEDRSEWRQISPTTTGGGMPVGNITDVAFDAFRPGGVAYVADKSFGVLKWTSGGFDEANLFDLTDDTWSGIGTVIFDFGGDVSSLVLRSDEVLWVGTAEGVYKFENGSFRNIRADRGFGVGILSNQVIDLVLDHDENLWVATDLGVDRIARDEDNDITSFTTPVVWQTQLGLYFPPEVVSPIADAFCHALTMHPTQNLLYIATRRGLSILDLSSLEPGPTDLATVYLFPNPIRTRRGHSSLKIANHTSLVDIEIYTLEGQLIHRVENVGASEDVVWDLTTESGFLAASGVYLVRITADTGTVIRTVSLIR
jgi:ligand-binding sensor domain-containing protein